MFADLIEKLMSKGKHLFAIKFVSEFDMTDKFPPVPILKAYVMESKRLAKKISEEGNNSKKAAVICHSLTARHSILNETLSLLLS